MLRCVVATIGTALALLAAGCGEPGSPQPPSLNLPVLVRNLAAQRTGDVVHLTWSTVDRTTDHTTPSGQITTRICRIESSNAVSNAACDRVGDQRRALGKTASFDDVLPINLTSATPVLLTYYVELVNHAQKSAGRSNPAYTAAGPAPAAVGGLVASVRAEGVVLQWEPAPDCAPCSLRIERQLQDVTPKPAARVPAAGFTALASQPPSPHQTLELPVTDSSFETIDRTAGFGHSYSYQVRRVESLTLQQHPIELLGPQSAPVTIGTRDIFPPSIPRDLAAVADDGSKTIDLSWTPAPEPDVAGYIVYRRQAGSGETPQRISTATLPAPAFQDNHVQPGQRYAYSVSSIDQSGNESQRSADAEETLAPPQN